MNCPVKPGDVLAGKYRIEEVIGEGGMGVVVAARHLELDQRVAMKFLLPSLTENKEATARFRREARAAVKIQSEHVARVLDVGAMEDGAPYIVIEYLDGQDVAAELRERGKFDPSEAAELVLEACEAIAAAHVVGIVHRDLKPSNLYLTQRADYSRCLKVLDFGISKSLTGDSGDSQFGLTRTRAVVGSPLYMAPEQLESSRNADERADIWSLGVILHELVTGSVPFRGESLPQLVRAVLVGDRVRPSSLSPTLTPEFEAVIDRCLATDRDQRYASVTELARALAPFAHAGAASALRVSRILRHSVAPGKTPGSSIERPSHNFSSIFEADRAPRTDEPPLVDVTAEAPTVSSWGNTSGAPRTNKRLWLGAGAFLVASAAIAFWLTREHREEVAEADVTTTHPVDVIPTMPEVAAAGAVAMPHAASAAEPAPQAVGTSSFANVALTQDLPSAWRTSATTSASTSASTPSIAAPRYVAPIAQPRPAPAPVQVPPATSSPEPAPFTNFGGRR